MLQKEMTTEFEKLIKQPVYIRCKPKSAPTVTGTLKTDARKSTAGSKDTTGSLETDTVEAKDVKDSGNCGDARETESQKTLASYETLVEHDQCPFSPSDVIIQLKVRIHVSQGKASFRDGWSLNRI